MRMKEIFLLKLGEIVLKGANKRQFAFRYPEGGESMMQMAWRVYSFIEDVKKNHSDRQSHKTHPF